MYVQVEMKKGRRWEKKKQEKKQDGMDIKQNMACSARFPSLCLPLMSRTHQMDIFFVCWQK